MSGQQVVLELIVFGSRGLVGSLMFTSPQKITIGREPHAMVHLDDPTVSLRHAVISLDGDSVVISDLGSRTGTWVNGEVTYGDHALKATDEINIGAFRVRQTIHRSAAPADAGKARGRTRPLAMPTPYEPHHPATAVALGRQSAAPTRRARAETDPGDEEVTTVGVSLKPHTLPPPSADDAGDVTVAVRRGSPQQPATKPHGEFGDIDRLLNAVLSDSGPAPRVEKRPAPSEVEEDAEKTISLEPRVGESLEERLERLERSAPVPAPVEHRPEKRIERRPESVQPARVEKAAPSSRSVQPAEARVEKRTERRAVRPAVLREPIASHEDEDDEEDDTNFVPPFDLLDSLARETAPSDTSGVQLAVEVARFRDDRVLWIRHLGRGQSLNIEESPTPLGAYEGDGSFVLYPKACGSLSVREADGQLAADETDALLRAPSLRLTPGREVLVDLDGGDGLMIHLVPRAAALAAARPKLRPILDRIVQGVCSVGVHLLVVVIVGIMVFGGKNSAAADINAGRFATIKIKDIEVEPPPPPPPPDPVQLDTATMTRPTPNQPLPKSKRSSKEPVPEHPEKEQAQEEPSASAQKILKALGGAPSGPDLGALSNLDAVPHGASTGFKVSDAVGKAPGDTLRLGGGGGEVNTKSAAEIGNDVGRVQVKTGNVVRARVTAPPAAVRVEGQLDRGEIQKVVNAHLFQVQGCYERQLAKNPSLAGKISFRWVITPTGSVGTTRVAQSSIQSVEVMSCIQSAIQGWTFPAPTGGSVTVTYPFAFTTFGN